MVTNNDIDNILDTIFPFIFAGFPDEELEEYLIETLTKEQYSVYLENKEYIHKILKIK